MTLVSKASHSRKRRKSEETVRMEGETVSRKAEE
jgi:hypothetical protein